MATIDVGRLIWSARRAGLALLAPALLWPMAAHALVMGELRVDSMLGEPLMGQIPIVDATAEELETFAASQAGADVYKENGADYSEQVASVSFRLDRADPGRPVLHVMSTARFTEPLSSLYVRARWGQVQLTREFPVMLDPPLLAAAPPVDDGPAVKPSVSNVEWQSEPMVAAEPVVTTETARAAESVSPTATDARTVRPKPKGSDAVAPETHGTVAELRRRIVTLERALDERNQVLADLAASVDALTTRLAAAEAQSESRSHVPPVVAPTGQATQVVAAAPTSAPKPDVAAPSGAPSPAVPRYALMYYWLLALPAILAIYMFRIWRRSTTPAARATVAPPARVSDTIQRVGGSPGTPLVEPEPKIDPDTGSSSQPDDATWCEIPGADFDTITPVDTTVRWVGADSLKMPGELEPTVEVVAARIPEMAQQANATQLIELSGESTVKTELRDRRLSAVDALMRAIRQDPARSDIRMQLFDLLHSTAVQHRDAFIQFALQAQNEAVQLPAEDRQRIAVMGRDIAPGHELLADDSKLAACA